jgi:hypothetical protein
MRAVLGFSLGVVAACAAAAEARAQSATAGEVTTSLWVPEGVTKLRGVLAFTGVGIGARWPDDADFRALAKRLELGVVTVRGEKSAGDDASYPTRCATGRFKMLLDSLTALGKASNHPELANAPIIGGGHSHGGDYWNYFNACYPDRMAVIFCKSSGGLQYSRGALRTPMVWEIGTADLISNGAKDFRGNMFAHRTKGSPLTLVLGPGEDHNNITAGARQMVIEVIEALWKLRVPAVADAASGPVVLRDLDESSGAYWLGDNYSKEIAPYATFPRKDALQTTSFLPSEELAGKWKAFGANLPASIKIDSNGVCSKCYPQVADEAPLKPINTGNPPSAAPADGGVVPPPDAGATPSADAAAAQSDTGGGATPTPPGAPNPPTPAAPPGVPAPGSGKQPTPSTSDPATGGCALAPANDRAPGSLVLLLLGMILFRLTAVGRDGRRRDKPAPAPTSRVR